LMRGAKCAVWGRLEVRVSLWSFGQLGIQCLNEFFR
jgi:hypothetical protein